MTIPEHASRFADLPVLEYDPDEGIQDPEGAAYRLALSYDDADSGQSMAGLLASFLEDPGASQVQALVIGTWENAYDSSTSSERIVEALVASSEKLPALRGLFLGDITSEETEISWITQSDVTALFDAYPRLEHFRVRGGTELVIGTLRHPNLRSLVVESGGLEAEVVRGILSSELPRLEHLELWLGDEGYGRTVEMDDLTPLFQGTNFPALRYLGLRDCQRADELAAALRNAPILERIKVLDLSLGDLGDEGAKALAENPAIARLAKLDLHHHFVSPTGIAAIEALGVAVDSSERQEPYRYGDKDHRYIAVSE